MRVYTERCLRNLQDRMIVCGFEGWDVFLVLGVALTLQMVKVNGLAVWLIAGALSAFLILIKKGKPPNATEHYLDWFFKEKQFTAVPQTIIESIKGRGLDFKLNSLQSLLPYSHFEDGYLVFKDDSISKGYEITCPGLDSLAPEELILYAQKIETFLNGLSERVTYQIFFTLDSNYQKEINEHKNIKAQHPLIKAMHSQRISKFEEIMQEKLFRRRRCHLFVNFSYLKPEHRKINLFPDHKRFTTGDVESFKHEFNLILNNIEEGLNGVGFQAKKMDQYSIMQLIYKYLNPDREKQGIECPKPKDEESFAKQVCCSDVYIDEKKGEYIHFGGFYHKFISLKILPEATSPAMLSELNNLSFPEFDVVVNFEAPPKEW